MRLTAKGKKVHGTVSGLFGRHLDRLEASVGLRAQDLEGANTTPKLL